MAAQFKLEKKIQHGAREDEIAIIDPLEESVYNHNSFSFEAEPTEQGRLLLEFIRKHIFKGDS